MSCIPKILELKGNKEFLNVIDPENRLDRADHGLTVEGGGEYRGFHYLITFTGCAHRCGYVAIPPDHVLSNKNIDLVSTSAPEPYDDLSVHGGITFHETGTHILERLMKGKLHCEDVWIGFDAAHAYDAKDWVFHEKYYGKECMDALSSCSQSFEKVFSEFSRPRPKIRTYDYMESECKSLIDQIITGMEKAA
jgi:hypothetical protein